MLVVSILVMGLFLAFANCVSKLYFAFSKIIIQSECLQEINQQININNKYI